MQNRNDTNPANTRSDVTKQLSPLGYCIAGIAMIFVLIVFGRLLLLLAVIGGIGWLLWKFRWALLYIFQQINRQISVLAQVYEQKCRKDQQAHRFYSTEFCNPFQTSRQYEPNRTGEGWDTGAAGRDSRRNVIFDVTHDGEDNR